MSEIINVNHLSRRFGDFTALQDVSFSVDAGEIFGFLGPNGAGKTTTVRILTTLLPATSGEAQVCGYPLGRPVEIRRCIGYVPQALSADGSLTGLENLSIIAKFFGLGRLERQQRIEEVLEVMQLSDYADSLVRTYSGGLVRRLEIAQAILHRPKILFLDEPTVGLDPVARRGVWAKLMDLVQNDRMTIFLTTHYMEEADQLCERVAIIAKGQISVIGTPQALKTQTGIAGTTLDDVFAHFTGNSLQEEGGSFRELRQTRRTSRRLS